MALQSQLLLFLSVDVVGSTAYKNSHREEDGVQPWLQFFKDFYQDFPEFLARAAGKQATKVVPSIWKTAGDELIFTVPIECHTEALRHVVAFRCAIGDYDAETTKKKLPLGFKACAWVAGFPVINAEVRAGGNSGPDYIGPLVDAGFRLAKYSDERRFVVSVELALLLAEAIDEIHLNPIFYYDGKQPLKGVLSERPYPIIWIDMLDGNKPLDEELLGIPKASAQPKKLAKFCREFIESLAPQLVIPYITACNKFSTVPEKHQRILANQANDPQELLHSGEAEPAGGDMEVSLDEPKLPSVTDWYPARSSSAVAG